MKTVNLGSKAAAGAVSSVNPFSEFIDENTGVFQANFTGTATVDLEGRLHPDLSYTVIATVASTDTTKAKIVALMPDMRLNITSHSSGVVSGYLGG